MQEEKKNINISTFQLIIILFIFVILIVIGFIIQDYNLKISYYLSVGLGIFTLINIYLTITYYLELRNKTGEKGRKGPKGDIGPKGDSGSCTFSTECNNNENCDDKVYKAIHTDIVKIDEDFKDISIECIKNPNKENCKDKNSETIEKIKGVNKLAESLIEECKQTRMSEKLFLERIKIGLDKLS